MVTKRQVEQAFEQTKKAARRHASARMKFDKLCDEFYGYGVCDDLSEYDVGIDELDYATGDSSLDEVMKDLKRLKEQSK